LDVPDEHDQVYHTLDDSVYLHDNDLSFHVQDETSCHNKDLNHDVLDVSNQFLDQMDRLTETLEQADRRLNDAARRAGR
jgi:hypothetical protein